MTTTKQRTIRHNWQPASFYGEYVCNYGCGAKLEASNRNYDEHCPVFAWSAELGRYVTIPASDR